MRLNAPFFAHCTCRGSPKRMKTSVLLRACVHVVACSSTPSLQKQTQHPSCSRADRQRKSPPESRKARKQKHLQVALTSLEVPRRFHRALRMRDMIMPHRIWVGIRIKLSQAQRQRKKPQLKSRTAHGFSLQECKLHSLNEAALNTHSPEGTPQQNQRTATAPRKPASPNSD